MYAGSSGFNYGVNKNSPGNGNGKWQGLWPSVGHARNARHINIEAGGNNRNVVFCMNQLGGVGRISNMFATTADGVNCDNNQVIKHGGTYTPPGGGGNLLGGNLLGASDDVNKLIDTLNAIYEGMKKTPDPKSSGNTVNETHTIVIFGGTSGDNPTRGWFINGERTSSTSGLQPSTFHNPDQFLGTALDKQHSIQLSDLLFDDFIFEGLRDNLLDLMGKKLNKEGKPTRDPPAQPKNFFDIGTTPSVANMFGITILDITYLNKQWELYHAPAAAPNLPRVTIQNDDTCDTDRCPPKYFYLDDITSPFMPKMD